MAEKRLVDQLFQCLTEQALDGLTASVQFAKQRHHRYVELGHWLYSLLQLDDSDIHRLLKFFNISPTALEREVTVAIGRIQTGYEGAPVLSSCVRNLVREAWLQANVGHHDKRIR